MMDQPADSIATALEDGLVRWPGAGRVHDCEVPENTYVELISGRRRFYVIHETGHDDEGAPQVGDFVAFYVAGHEWGVRLFVITLLWTHGGIAPGWLIASLRPVRLALGE